MQTSDSLPNQESMPTGMGRETVPVRRGERARETPEASMESEGGEDAVERTKTKEELMAAEVATFPPEKLQKEQDRLLKSVKQWESFLAENREFMEAQLPFLEQKMKEERAMLEAIRMQRGKLGDYPDIPRAPRMAIEYAPTEYPRNATPTITPEARKRARDAVRPTEPPPSSLPN
jgi:hypothetical protein